MRLTITLQSDEKINLPVNYNHMIQAMIYNVMDDPTFRAYLHEHGFELGKRSFKMFTFSWLMGKSVFEESTKRIIFEPPVKLVVCSPMNSIMRELGSGLLKKKYIRLGENLLQISEIATMNNDVNESRIRVKMLSPIVVYSTFEKPDQNKQTHYYSPFEERFNELVKQNLEKKYFIVYGENLSEDGFLIEPVKVGGRHFVITSYKNTWIKGWMGEYELRGNPKLLKLALDAGLGSKNSLGYGCCEVVQGK
ncbi:CRISPR-associated endoribonuclease Cas6 [Pseudothermotoga thermarum]|uniref:CRISPR-associated endoribonuclease n=1 Tax=Pseudothermotoga thermarum DSM 5069 TaxID=688269 RepID=F7YTK7_9THEM|nr:CRISPR-associated endoribonuclease Cas6 [Pseudothermotoga thermarum]AEH51229.1 CRISPR-associated protein, Cas6 family [Pseudothermotoga thermarum DSM 5069]